MATKFKIILLFFHIALTGFSQDGMYNIEFYFTHSLRIPMHYVDIKISKRWQEISINAKTRPLENYPQWAKSGTDTTFSLSQEQFQAIINSVKSISCLSIEKEISEQTNSLGLDGVTCKINYGIQDIISYTIWSPDVETKKRGLTNFLNCCNLIIKTAGLDAKKVLE